MGGGGSKRGGVGIHGCLKGDRYDEDTSRNIPLYLGTGMIRSGSGIQHQGWFKGVITIPV